MTDYTELKRLATRIVEVQTSQDVPISKLFDDFEAAASPETILALIAENEGLHAQHARDSGELRKLCAARDSARRERDQFKANSERHKMDLECAQLNLSIAVGVKNSQQSELHEAKAENEALRKDAERYRAIRDEIPHGDLGKAIVSANDAAEYDAAIDAAMSNGEKP